MPEIIHITETASTNKYIRERMQQSPLDEGSVVWTDFQTAGRGQAGNSWESDVACNLTFSIVIYPASIPANAQFLISQITALSVKEMLNRYIDDVTVKWPNDIYWKDKKICGMLIENDLMGKDIYCSVIGIGININQAFFKSGAPNPVSLANITRQSYDIETELHSFLRVFYDYYLLLLKGDFLTIRTRYSEALYRKEGYHTYADEQGIFDARISGIEPTGHILLQLRNGNIRRYAFKEVKCVIDANTL